MNKNEHTFSPEKKPKGTYPNRHGNDCYDKMEIEADITEERLPTSLFAFECPECHSRAYADGSYQKWIVKAQAIAAAINFQSFQVLGLACEPCHAVMSVTRLDQS